MVDIASQVSTILQEQYSFSNKKKDYLINNLSENDIVNGKDISAELKTVSIYIPFRLEKAGFGNSFFIEPIKNTIGILGTGINPVGDLDKAILEEYTKYYNTQLPVKMLCGHLDTIDSFPKKRISANCPQNVALYAYSNLDNLVTAIDAIVKCQKDYLDGIKDAAKGIVYIKKFSPKKNN